MELTAIEKYFIDKVERQEKELEELKNFKEKVRSDSDIIIKKVLHEYYYTYVYSWYIKEDNYEKYIKALKERDFNWLSSHEYQIYSGNWNLELQINDHIFKLYYYTSQSNRKLDVVETEKDNMFYTKEEAQEHLLKILKKDLLEFAKNHSELNIDEKELE